MELRIDADLAAARREFEASARAVDQLGDEFDTASDRADELGREAARLEDHLEEVRREAAAMGSAFDDEMRDRLQAATDAARAGERAFEDATDDARRLARALDEAEDEADRLQDRLNRLDADAGTGFNRARRGLLGFIMGARQAGQNVQGAFADGFSGLPAAIRGPVIAAGIVAGTMFAAAAGGVIAGVMLTAVGAGLAGAGVMIAAKTSDVVQGAFRDAFGPIGDDVEAFALMFEGPLVRSARMFREAWADVGGDVREMFADVLPLVEPLAAGLAGLAEEALPGLGAAAEAAGPVVRELALQLPELGEAVGDMFESFGEGSEGAVKGIRALVLVVGGTLRAVGNTVEFLADAFDFWTEAMERTLAVASQIPIVGALFEDAAGFWADFNASGDGSIRALDGTAEAGGRAEEGLRRTADAARDAGRAAVLLSEKLSQLIGLAMGTDQAMIAWEAAIDGVTDAVKENGRSLDIGTEKGRANVGAVLDGVEAAERLRQATIDAAGGQNASAAAVDAANAKFRQQVGQLEALLLKLGFTRAQVDALLGKYKELAAAPNITKSFTVEYRTAGSIPKDMRVGVGNVRGYATGGTPPPGWAWVGERGPELLNFSGRERVYSAMESARLMAGAAAGGASGGYSSGGGGGRLAGLRYDGRGGGLESIFLSWLDEMIRTGQLTAVAA